MQNVTKCPRCDKTFINEELDSHVCNPRFTGIIQIGIVYWFEGQTNKDGDKIIMAKGFDGKLYQLVHCEHNPPHILSPSTESKHDKHYRQGNSTSQLVVSSFHNFKKINHLLNIGQFPKI